MKSLLLLASFVAMTACTTVSQEDQAAKKDSLSKENQSAIIEATGALKK